MSVITEFDAGPGSPEPATSRGDRMLYTVWDTETTGFTKNLPPEDPSQPDIVQLAAMLLSVPEASETGDVEIISQLSLLVHGEIPVDQGAFEVHGISRDKTRKMGVPRASAVRLLKDLLAVSDIQVGHNLEFDLKIMRSAAHRAGIDMSLELAKPVICTMRQSTDICKIPGTRNGYKWPKAQEAHQKLCKCAFVGAHDALADVRATARIFCALVGLPSERMGKLWNKQDLVL